MKQTIRNPSGVYRGISVGLNISEFAPVGCDDLPPPDTVLEGIRERYRADTASNFVLDLRTEVDVQALWDLLGRGDHDTRTALLLVSDIVRNLYTAPEVTFTDDGCTEDRVPDDSVWEVVMGPEGASVAEACEMTGVDRFAVCRSFPTVYGRTPHALRKHHRMLTAASMILLGERSMGTVAHDVGYGSESKFADSFRREFGCRPKHFLREYLAGNGPVTPSPNAP